MRILVAGDYTQPWRAPAWARALRELGLEVIEYDLRSQYSLGLLGKVERRYVVGPGIFRINQRLLRLASEYNPDVILVYAGQPVLPSTVQTLSRSFWVTGYQNDDVFGGWKNRFGGRFFRAFIQSLRFYTSYHVFRDINVSEYQQHGCSRVKLLRYFYLPWQHYPIKVNSEDRERLGADVLFIGAGQPDTRVHYVIALLDAGVNLRIYGNMHTWRRYLPESAFHRLQPISLIEGHDYAKAICSAKICLAMFSKTNRDQYSLRSFEIPACGGFMLAERTSVMLSLFREGEEAEYFSDASELLAKVHYYLTNEDLRVWIATAGRERCLRDRHDVYSRMRQWLSDLAEWGCKV